MPEQLGILLLFLAILLFNLIGAFLKRRRDRNAEAEKKQMPQPARPSVRHPRRTAIAPPPSELARPLPSLTARPRRRLPLGRRALRHAVIVMTLLEAPRALIDERPDGSR